MNYEQIIKGYAKALVKHVEFNLPEFLLESDNPLRALRNLRTDIQTCEEIFPLCNYLLELASQGIAALEDIEPLWVKSELDLTFKSAIEDAFSEAEMDLMAVIDKKIIDRIGYDPFDDMDARDFERQIEINWGRGA